MRRFLGFLLSLLLLSSACQKQTDYSADINALRASRDSLAAALKITNANLLATNNALASLSSSVTAIQTQLGVISGQITTLNTQLTATNAIVAGHTTTIATIQAQIKTIQDQIATLNSQQTTTSSLVSGLSTTVSSIQAQITSVLASIATLKTNDTVIQTALNSLIVSVSLSNNQLTSLVTELNSLLAKVPTLTDIDGNVYKTVIIGTQIWMAENLRTTKYRNGDPIPNITNGTTWPSLVSGAYCDFNNNAINGITYGHLYNFYTITDSRQLCPSGWHVPSYLEWCTLINNLGGFTPVAAAKLREVGTAHWSLPGGTNTSEFTALGGSWRGGDGLFYYYIGQSAWWWTSTEQQIYNPYSIGLGTDNNLFANWDPYHAKAAGSSIRCIKD
jgi:uncharacterized protein (TIGR02145 family)